MSSQAEHDAAMEEFFRSIVENLDDPIVVLDPEGRPLYKNPALDGMTDVAAAPQATDFFAGVHPDDQLRVRQAFADTVRQGIGRNIEYRYVLANGDCRDIEARSVAISDEMGNTLRVVLGLRDVSAGKRIDRQLRLAALAFETHVGMMITDTNDVILHVNRAFSRITGYSPEEAIGRTPHLLSSGRHDGAFYTAMWASINSKGVWSGEIWNRQKNGEIYAEWLTITAVQDARNVVTHYVASFNDITERKASEDAIRNLAFYDPLTGLPNRRLLLDRLHQVLATNARSGMSAAMLFIDLDKFKDINDRHGHDVGDLLLQQAAERLVSCVREGDTVARLGGDEFVVMLASLNANDAHTQARIVGEKILEQLGQHYLLKGNSCLSTPSIGITVFGKQRLSPTEILKQADLAMYRAKAGGRNSLCFYEPGMEAP